MAPVAPPVVDMNHAAELLELAHKILCRTRDQDLIQKVSLLQDYLELSRTNPDRSYDDIVPKTLDELTALVHLHLNGEVDKALKGRPYGSHLNIEYVPRAVAELSEEVRQIEDLMRSVEQTLSDPQTSLGEAMRLANWSKQTRSLRTRQPLCSR